MVTAWRVLETIVENLMADENLHVEVKRNGKWIDETGDTDAR